MSLFVDLILLTIASFIPICLLDLQMFSLPSKNGYKLQRLVDKFAINGQAPKNWPPFQGLEQLVETLVSSQRAYGAEISKGIADFRELLEDELFFQRSWEKEFIQGVLKIIGMSLCTWGLIYFSKGVLTPPKEKIIALQFIGLCLTILLFKLVYLFSLKKIQKFTRQLIKFQTYLSSGLPVGEILEKTSVTQCVSFPLLGERLDEILISWKDHGAKVKNEVSILISESTRLRKQRLKHAEGLLTFGQFFILSVFFLGAHFLLIIEGFSL